MRPRLRAAFAPLPAITALFALASIQPAAAHVRSLSYSKWELTGAAARVEVRLTALDATALALEAELPEAGDGADPLAAYLVDHLRLSAGGRPCVPEGEATARTSAEGWHTYAWDLRCPGTAELVMESDLFLPENPAHLHFARLRLPDGGVTERVLAEGDRSWSITRDAGGEPAEGTGTGFLGYVGLGIEHIVSGWDHLAFVLALLLLARSLRELGTLVTAFTVAHSITLGLATIGLLRPQAAAVESMIGFSIALVAVENVWLLDGRGRAIPFAVGIGLVIAAVVAWLEPRGVTPLALVGLGIFSLCHFALLDRSSRRGTMRAAVAFAFGLIHGFGFAGVLAEMDLPRSQLASALLGFNLGVEIGQLGVVALAWPLLVFLRRLREGRVERLVAEVGSAAICALGLYWFVVRTFA